MPRGVYKRKPKRKPQKEPNYTKQTIEIIILLLNQLKKGLTNG